MMEAPVRARGARRAEVNEGRRHRSEQETEHDHQCPETNHDTVSADTEQTVAGGNQTLSVQLSEQEEAVKREKTKIEGRKTLSKEKVAGLFETLRDILTAKENELLEEVNVGYDTSLEKMDGIIRDIANEKARLQGLKEYGCVDNEDEVMNQIKHCMTERENILKDVATPDLNVNDDSIEAMKDLSFGELTLNNFEVSNNEAVEESDDIPETEPNVIDLETDFSTDDVINELAELEVAEDNVVEEEAIDSYDDYEQSEDFSVSERSLGATGYVEASQSVMPTAPPLPQNVEEPPPPYWQAVGLNEPDVAPSSTKVPAYDDIAHTNRLPENVMHVWHSFPVRRQYDRKGPLVVAMTWNHGRICITDRANQKVKFYYPNGTLTKEMQFIGYELYDVTFLEEVQGEVRYLLSCPKSKVLIIISINFTNIATVVKKIDTAYFYTCVCRGPIEQTLVGTEVFPLNQQYRPPAVHVFTFSGEVLTTITLTPSYVPFIYPKALEVYESYIAVLDWKLSTVCVYNQDGSPVGEYRGTSQFPLANPLHMTLDQMGNILILNGDHANIHSIDLHCNPLEVIKIPRNISGTASAKLLAFDAESCRLCLARGNGEIAVYTFRNGYDALKQRNLVPRHMFSEQNPVRREPTVLPLVEGMLPSTIESIASRHSGRNRSRQFHL